MRRITNIGVAIAVVMVASVGAPAGATPPDVNAAPPSALALVEGTNAMLRSSDVMPALASEPPEDVVLYPYTTGYTNSFAGGDPIDVCSSPSTGLQVFPSTDGTIVYQARATGGDLVQYVYSYPTEAAAATAWDILRKQIRSQCNGSATLGGVKESASSTSIPGIGGIAGLAVTSSIDHQFATVLLLGSSIQMVSITSADKPTNTAERAAAVISLATTLGGRWVARASLPLTQDPLITQAARSMQQPADLTAATPVMQPARAAGKTPSSRH